MTLTHRGILPHTRHYLVILEGSLLNISISVIETQFKIGQPTKMSGNANYVPFVVTKAMKHITIDNLVPLR